MQPTEWTAADARRLLILLAYQCGDLTIFEAAQLLGMDEEDFALYRDRVYNAMERAVEEFPVHHRATGEHYG